MALLRRLLRPRLEEAGSIDYALQAARAELKAAREQLNCLPPSPARESLLAMPDYVLERTF